MRMLNVSTLWGTIAVSASQGTQEMATTVQVGLKHSSSIKTQSTSLREAKISSYYITTYMHRNYLQWHIADSCYSACQEQPTWNYKLHVSVYIV